MKSNKISKNLIFQILYQLVLMLTPLVTSPYISRVLTKEGLGIYSYTLSIASTFATLSMLGISSYGNRAISRKKDDIIEKSKTFFSIYIIQLISVITFIILYLLFILLFSNNNYLNIHLVLVIQICSCLVDFNWFVYGMEEFTLTSTRSIIIKLLSVLLTFKFVRTYNDINIYSLIIASSSLVSNVVLIPYVKKEIVFVKINKEDILKHIKPILLLSLPVISGLICSSVGAIILGTLAPIEQSGIYENTNKIINLPLGLISSLGIVMFPRISYLNKNNQKDKINEYLKISIELICISSFALIFGIISISKDFVLWFFDETYIEVAKTITIMSISIFLKSINDILIKQCLLPFKKDKIYLTGSYLKAFVYLVIELLLIKKYGVYSIILAIDISELICLIYYLIYVNKENHILKLIFNNVYYLIFAVIMYFIVKATGNNINNMTIKIITKIATGAISYILMCLPLVIKRYKNILKRWNT